mmetsp:Transcript_11610/g.17729  ORF Transcript_11610/g.17729 Transcript_11610/m.17729 type:complete len:397 (+) Transcript_11610:191-1381(+)
MDTRKAIEHYGSIDSPQVHQNDGDEIGWNNQSRGVVVSELKSRRGCIGVGIVLLLATIAFASSVSKDHPPAIDMKMPSEDLLDAIQKEQLLGSSESDYTFQPGKSCTVALMRTRFQHLSSSSSFQANRDFPAQSEDKQKFCGDGGTYEGALVGYNFGMDNIICSNGNCNRIDHYYFFKHDYGGCHTDKTCADLGCTTVVDRSIFQEYGESEGTPSDWSWLNEKGMSGTKFYKCDGQTTTEKVEIDPPTTFEVDCTENVIHHGVSGVPNQRYRTRQSACKDKEKEFLVSYYGSTHSSVFNSFSNQAGLSYVDNGIADAYWPYEGDFTFKCNNFFGCSSSVYGTAHCASVDHMWYLLDDHQPVTKCPSGYNCPCFRLKDESGKDDGVELCYAVKCKAT